MTFELSVNGEEKRPNPACVLCSGFQRPGCCWKISPVFTDLVNGLPLNEGGQSLFPPECTRLLRDSRNITLTMGPAEQLWMETQHTYCCAYSEDKQKALNLQSSHYCFLLAVRMPPLLPQTLQVPLFDVCFVQT